VTQMEAGGVYAVVRIAAVLAVGLLAAACGSSTTSAPSRRAAPSTPTPTSGRIGPPAAWLETRADSRWLGFSSYCWRKGNRGICSDSIAPKCGQKGVPDVPVTRGEKVRAHLGYTPEEASVEHADAKLAGRTVTWQVDRAGPFVLFTRGKGNDASYVGCAVFG
jgi:hypothetical protein